MASTVCLERTSTDKVDLSIEYAAGEETFEVYMNRIKPAGPLEKEALDKQFLLLGVEPVEDKVTTIDLSHLCVYELVDQERWATVYAYLEHNEQVATIPFLSSSPAFDASCQGNYLLHHACRQGAPEELIARIVQANPKAASVPGHDGWLPLHYACAFPATQVGTVQSLLDTYASAVTIREEKKKQLPLHVAAQTGASLEIVALLLSYSPDAAVVRDLDKKRPVDLVKRIVDLTKKFELLTALETAQEWIPIAERVSLRLEEDFVERRRAMERDYGNYVRSLKAGHDEEINKIAGDLLNTELDREVLREELDKGKDRMDQLDLELQDKMRRMGDKHELFLDMQEQARLERVELKREHDTKVELLHSDLKAHEDKVSELSTQLTEATDKVQDLETKLQVEQDEAKQHALEHRLEVNEANDKIKALEAKIATLEKGNRMKEGIIKKVTEMARTKEEEANNRIGGLLGESKEQQLQMNLLLAKLDVFEHQVNVLQERLG
eukprot:Nitzschia sp. Nitz4//scaffold82_size85912//7827//9314//NITZ4_005124-RA/size85912-processed-gene-0.3-mRNA-1//1//CDS//3329558784//5334//frame0